MAITLDGAWKDKVCGMCGDFDQDVENDFQDRNGRIVQSPIEFGNSWLSDYVKENNHPQRKLISRRMYSLECYFLDLGMNSYILPERMGISMVGR